jgi:hypothetical protein
MTKHSYTVKGYICAIISNPEDLQRETPYFCFTSYKPSDPDFVLIREYEHTIEIDFDPNAALQSAVAGIDATIQKKRLELEDELQNLRDKKANFLSLTYTGTPE